MTLKIRTKEPQKYLMIYNKTYRYGYNFIFSTLKIIYLVNKVISSYFDVFNNIINNYSDFC